MRLLVWTAVARCAYHWGRVMSSLSTRMKRRIKRKLGDEKPTVWIGKKGISEELLGEIEKQLDTKEIIKVRTLRSALETRETAVIASKIADRVEASLVDLKGHTFILFRRRKR